MDGKVSKNWFRRSRFRKCPAKKPVAKVPRRDLAEVFAKGVLERLQRQYRDCALSWYQKVIRHWRYRWGSPCESKKQWIFQQT